MSDDTPDPHVDNAEPSMEDILASIRRIIADEDGVAASEEAGAPDVSSESYTIVQAEQESSKDLNDNEDTLSDVDMLLAELDDGGADNLPIDILEQTDVDDGQSKLKGLGAVAAASLGALASAGTATAESITKARRNPKPEPMTPSPSIDSMDESLDLLLDSDDIVSEVEDDLETLLQIPDSDGTKGEDDIDALLEQMLSDGSPSNEIMSDDHVIDPAADMIDEYEAQTSDLLAADSLDVADEGGNELSDELLAELLGSELEEGLTQDQSPNELTFDSGELPETPQSTKDLDLVKSLMADLTADPYDASQDDASEEVASADEETDFVDEVLSLSMNDEAALQAHDEQSDGDNDTAQDETEVAAADASAEPFVIDMHEDLSVDAPPEQSPASSLAEIAKAAEADADSLKRRTGFGAAGFAAGAGVVITSIGEDDRSESVEIDPEVSRELQEAQDVLTEIKHLPPDETGVDTIAETKLTESDTLETETNVAEQTPHEPNLTQETADMPKAAAKQDTIIDEVTEEATAGAFASLNQVVENRAVVADRGDRIGDLVAEALRPMLKEWLDKNLKGIVERAVTKEVKRISSGK